VMYSRDLVNLSDTCVRDVLERRECDWRVVRCDDVKMALTRRRERRRWHEAWRALEQGGRERRGARNPIPIWTLRLTGREVR